MTSCPKACAQGPSVAAAGSVYLWDFTGSSPGRPYPLPRRSGPPAGSHGRVRRSLRGVRGVSRRLGAVAGLSAVALLVWRLGGGTLLYGMRGIDATVLLAALGIGALTTVSGAWRWQLVARGMAVRLPLGTAVAAYYRALFLGVVAPGGVPGPVWRAVGHGVGETGRGARAGTAERAVGLVVLAVACAVVLLCVPSPVRGTARRVIPLLVLAAWGALAVLMAVRMGRPHTGRPGRSPLTAARRALLSRRDGPRILSSSAVVLAGHAMLFLLAARVTGVDAPTTRLLPLAALALLATCLSPSTGGWGPREGVTSWAFGAAELGAGHGLAAAAVYGVLSLTASLPGAALLLTRAGRRPTAAGQGACTAASRGASARTTRIPSLSSKPKES
ncbi:lysylphosphatidylglycerol synthase transmembrane domain-containing protein [Streptomyces capillispiralis]|uniref:Uncharacterized membrane protein YbhN (UPF0104 family) n=1 Tax=Streptomyces capillispiralis TaxID=68182 RepID=A0A561SGT4_9ACTN|nr:lysylphosphatidylglycerol synthase transmembrane domain-containing protein [Streptomyces capillispiralis]TWF74075.1 uncharacterized membrane protein YbhN (UPF0104 family) [Streptomyces capillispiralis]GHH96419.1 hypothetical protein GCM10017779_68760 [Streptomyces capillispiralis]